MHIVNALKPETVNVIKLDVITREPQDNGEAVETYDCHDYRFEPRQQVLELYAVINGRLTEAACLTRVISVAEVID